MSGGSYDYAHGRIETLADEVEHRTKVHPTAMAPLRLAFVAHLRLVAGATGAELDVTIDRAREALDALAIALKRAEEKRQET